MAIDLITTDDSWRSIGVMRPSEVSIPPTCGMILSKNYGITSFPSLPNKRLAANLSLEQKGMVWEYVKEFTELKLQIPSSLPKKKNSKSQVRGGGSSHGICGWLQALGPTQAQTMGSLKHLKGIYYSRVSCQLHQTQVFQVQRKLVENGLSPWWRWRRWNQSWLKRMTRKITGRRDFQTTQPKLEMTPRWLP